MNIQNKFPSNLSVVFAFYSGGLNDIKRLPNKSNELIMKTLELFISLFAPQLSFFWFRICLLCRLKLNCVVKCQWNLHNWRCVSRMKRNRHRFLRLSIPRRRNLFALAVRRDEIDLQMLFCSVFNKITLHGRRLLGKHKWISQFTKATCQWHLSTVLAITVQILLLALTLWVKKIVRRLPNRWDKHNFH